MERMADKNPFQRSDGSAASLFFRNVSCRYSLNGVVLLLEGEDG